MNRASTMLPIISLSGVYHIGTLEADRRGQTYRSSMEGECLSVSLCPQAWRAIARLGGSPLKLLRPNSGEPARFLDVHAVLDSPALLRECLDWSKKSGLTRERMLWRASMFDENDDEFFILCETRQAAINEAGSDSAPKQVPVIVGEPTLMEKMGIDYLHKVDATSYAVMAWAQSLVGNSPEDKLDGVWWRETYSPGDYSAPRGGIFPDRLALFASKEADWDRVSHDKWILGSFPESAMVAFCSGAEKSPEQNSGFCP